MYGKPKSIQVFKLSAQIKVVKSTVNKMEPCNPRLKSALKQIHSRILTSMRKSGSCEGHPFRNCQGQPSYGRVLAPVIFCEIETVI